MKIDGRSIAATLGEAIKKALEARNHHPTLRVFVVSKDAATEQFIRIKKKAGESVGVRVDVVELPETTTTAELIRSIVDSVSETNGIVVQLPLPSHLDVDAVLAVIPPSHDVDALGTSPRVLAPVVAAFRHILDLNRVAVADKRVTIVGQGRLVGRPAAEWFRTAGAKVTICDIDDDLRAGVADADIVALGAGVPHMLAPDMIKDGAVILDAGASEAGGRVVGDADPACEAKASLFTPVPGGIGPIAVMMIFRNMLELTAGR